jgi:hypothetical protein
MAVIGPYNVEKVGCWGGAVGKRGYSPEQYKKEAQNVTSYFL